MYWYVRPAFFAITIMLTLKLYLEQPLVAQVSSEPCNMSREDKTHLNTGIRRGVQYFRSLAHIAEILNIGVCKTLVD